MPSHVKDQSKKSKRFWADKPIAVCCDKGTKHVNMLHGQNKKITNIAAGGKYTYHYVLKI
jgi:hypothetical protein